MPARPPVLFAVLALAGLAAAGDPDLPPLHLAVPADVAGPAGGEAVSRPLGPCDLQPDAPPAVAADPYLGGHPGCGNLRDPLPHPFGGSWTSLEYLAWWPKGQAVPPLVTAARGVPVVGGPGTAVLVGGGGLGSPTVSGGRFTKGFALDDAGLSALSVTYFFLGTRTDGDVVVGRAGRPRQVGRPFVDAATGEAGVLPVGGGGFDGAVGVFTSVRVTGWEVTGLWSLFAGPSARLNALAGYRYFQTNEGLRLDQSAWNAVGLAASASDQFDARNTFHGGQLGLSADLSRGPLLIELTGKVALGQGTGVVRVAGATAVRTAAGRFEQYPAGVFAVASNAARTSQAGFAVLPEATVKLGYQFHNRSKVFLGYNFVYLSEAVRPGDQLDATVDLAQVPLNQRAVGVGDRPAPLFVRSDFWVQGLTLGLEYRY